MKEYVVGFAFDGEGNVALIEKTKPAWQRGRFNGIGGKIEVDQREKPVDAMSREFFEETGVYIHPDQWNWVGGMYGNAWNNLTNHPDTEDWRVFVYTCTNPEVKNIRTTTEKEVFLWPVDMKDDRMIENVPALIKLCSIKPEPPSKRVPYFTLEY